MNTKLLGRFGEAAVAEHLQGKGYRVVGCNYQTRFGELDLIAQKGEYLCFVEVKLRKNNAFAAAREFVTAAKQEKLRTTAALYLAEHPSLLQPRFDVAEVYAPDGVDTKKPKIVYFENAF